MTNSYHCITFGFGFLSAVNSPSYSGYLEIVLDSNQCKETQHRGLSVLFTALGRHPRHPDFLLHSGCIKALQTPEGSPLQMEDLRGKRRCHILI